MRILLLLPLVAFVAACSIYRQRLNAQSKFPVDINKSAVPSEPVILSESEGSLVNN